MSKTILAVVHQATSDPGRIGARLQARGYHVQRCCPMAGESLPAPTEDHAGVVVFGGPMSANDTGLDGIRAELDWLPGVLNAGLPYLGVCLGAQLMTRVLGGAVSPHPAEQAEIGYYPIYPTAAGRGLFPASLNVYHWHREGFAVPAGAELLAAGEHFPNQAYRYGELTYGIQFHPEVTRPIMERWLTSGAEHLERPGAQPADQHRSGHDRYDAALGQWLEHFLDQWLSPAPARTTGLSAG